MQTLTFLSSESGSAGGEARRRLRIVVVDDDHDTVITLLTLLRDEGHEAWGYYRAKEVMRGVEEHAPDVVIIDIGLPDGSGYAVAEDIRRRYGSKRPLLIALTGLYKRPPHDRLSRIVGCDHFLTKPFQIEELLALIAPLTLPGGNSNGR